MSVEPLSDRVVRIVDLQTTEKQQDGTRASTVVQILAANGSHPGADVKEAIQDALEAGDLDHDESGRLRVPEDVDVPSRY